MAGEKRGSTWVLKDEGLLIGRDDDNDVVLDDPVVSRQHCRLRPAADGAALEDLGGKNPLLVNGLPTKQGTLKVGDELSLGRERFLLARAEAPRPTAGAKPGVSGTLSWEKAEPISLELDAARPATEGRPRTVQDLVMLYEVTREFGRCATLAELVAAVRHRLEERFNPQGLWIALVQGRDDLTFYEQTATAGAPPPLEAIQRALDERRGLLVPRAERLEGRKALVFTLVSPVVLGSVIIGVLCVETAPPRGAYTEEDLRFLVLLAQALAPILWFVEDVEQLRRDNEQLRARSGEGLKLVGTSRAMAHVRGQIAKAAKSKLSVLITGETGTGKELVARNLHARSGRHAGPLILVNCAAIPHELFESVLFGYEKGAFTGAHQASAGLMAQAHGGTLFLDEISELSVENQAGILRAIEYGAFRRIGAKEETRVDMRVVAATNRDIDGAVRSGAFRKDLFHRLNGFEIHIPPLRERPSDVPVLAQHFFEMAKDQAKRPLQGIAPEAVEYLRAQAWPGNVRELRNCILRAVSLAQHDRIEVEDVLGSAPDDAAHPSDDPFLSLADLEQRHITAVLHACGGNVKATAKVLQIARSTLYKKMQQHGIK